MIRFRRRLAAALVAVTALGAAGCQPKAGSQSSAPHNVVILVADGLRYSSVNPTDAPALDAVRANGVDFTNSHALYPTVTTVNASAIATGHYIGDTGDFSNAIYPGAPPLKASYFSRLASVENDDVLRDLNERFGGNYINETTLLAAARAKGYNVAALGKTGPTAIQDMAALTDAGGIVIDEATQVPEGIFPKGVPLSPELSKAIADAKLPPTPPLRSYPDKDGVSWLVSVATDILLPKFKADNKPFVMVFWSPDPDISQHEAVDGDLYALSPGINGPTSKGAISNASSALERIQAALKAQGLDKTTDIFVTADHGFATVSKESKNAYSASLKYRDYPEGQLPPGFLAIDLAHALNLPLYQTNGLPVAVDDGLSPKGGSAMLGEDIDHPHVIVSATGGSDLIYLPEDDAKALAPRIVEALTQQDYTAAIFVDDQFGKIPGALALSDVRLVGSAKTPRPAILVTFRSYNSDCGRPQPELCTIEVSDTGLAQGQGMHGGLSRAVTRNFMAAIGPDFKAKFANPAPVSNADIAPTIAHILGIDLPSIGTLKGRVISEALVNGKATPSTSEVKTSEPAANGFKTILNLQHADGAEYYDFVGAAPAAKP